jgi:hypothetical protein
METEALLTRYREIRGHISEWQSAALHTVPSAVIRDHAKRIGLLYDGGLGGPADPEMNLVFDLAVHTAKEGRSRAIDRIAKQLSLPEDSLESMVMRGLRTARFTAWRVEGPHEAAGLWVEDLFYQTRLWLMDERFSKTVRPGMMAASRIAPMGEYWVSCGAAVPLGDTVLELASEQAFTNRTNDRDTALRDRRFAEVFYRAAVKSGAMDAIAFRPPDESGPRF